MLQDTLASGMVFTSTGQCLRWHTAASHLYSVYTTCHVRRRVRQAARRQCCHSAAAGNTARTVEASSTPGYRIRAATPEDVQRLCKIEQLCDEYSAGWGEAEIQDELSKEFSRMLVAADQVTDHALGYIVGWHVAGELQVLELAVDPAHQSQGIGTALLGALLQQCGCCKDAEATLEVKEGNEKAVKLYKKCGFRQVGCRPRYYADGSAALLLTREPR